MTDTKEPYERMIARRLPCGGTPIFDRASECGHICDQCFAVIGSVGMPRECYDAMKAQEQKQKQKP